MLLLGPERANIADQSPPIVLGQMSPGGHGSAARIDLPEDLAVGLALDFLRCPVGGLGIEGSRGCPVALAPDAMAGNAIRLRHLLALGDRLGVGGQRILLVLLGGGRRPRRLLSDRWQADSHDDQRETQTQECTHADTHSPREGFSISKARRLQAEAAALTGRTLRCPPPRAGTIGPPDRSGEARRFQ